ncbi:MAG TPA: hypothetical protein VNK89_12550, partial [Thermoflexus sp.]|nr:hypothetical protein [Thermoflexus sp.]
LGDVVRAVPGQRFEVTAAAYQVKLNQVSEHIEVLARTLEEALERLEGAFQQAAHLVAQGSREAMPLPTVPLAMDVKGNWLPSQFTVQIPADRIQALIDQDANLSPELKAQLKEAIQRQPKIPYNLACGWVALSMALSHQLGRMVPAQEVVDQALEAHPDFRKRVIRNLVEDLGKRPIAAGAADQPSESYVTTGEKDLNEVARAYGVRVGRFDVPPGEQNADAVWDHLQGRLQQGEDVIALVNATQSDHGEPPLRNQVPGTALRFSEEHDGETLPAGGRLRPWTDSQGTIAHWVVVNRLEEHDGKRFVVINNPFHNRTERYPWEEFLQSVDAQARAGSQWWFLSVRRTEMEGRP